MQLRPGAKAGVHQSPVLQFLQRRLIERRAAALVIWAGTVLLTGADVPVQPQPLQVPLRLCAVFQRTAAVSRSSTRNKIFPPFAVRTARQQRAEQVSQVSRPLGDGAKRPKVSTVLHLPYHR